MYTVFLWVLMKQADFDGVGLSFSVISSVTFPLEGILMGITQDDGFTADGLSL
jgi:hypothetical protein